MWCPAVIGYGVFIALLGSAVLLVGPVTQLVFSHDFFTIMEGAWKITQGYRPYLDFHTLIGPLPYLIIVLGIQVTGPVASAMPVSNVLTLIPMATIAWYLLSTRFTPIGAFCCGAYLALLWCAPNPLHFRFFIHSYAMIYNRESYVLLCLVFLSMAVRPRKNFYLKGVLLGLLFFFKVPYFMAGLGFVGFYLLFTGISRRELLWWAAGFLTAFLPVFLYLGEKGTVDMFIFMVDAGKNRTPDVMTSTMDLLWAEFPITISLVLFLAVCSRWTESRFQSEIRFFPQAWPERIQVLAEPLVVLLAAILAEIASCPLFTVIDVPLICVYAFLVLDRVFRKANWPAWRAHAWTGLPTLAVGLVLILPVEMRALTAMAEIVYLKLSSPSYRNAQIFAPGLSDMKMCDRCGLYPRGVSYPDKVNDGIGLIQKHPELDHSIIATLDFSDPFSFSLQRHSPPHMPLALQYGFNVSESMAPDPEQIFKGSQAIMVPKYPEDPAQTMVVLRPKYDNYLTHHFVVLDQSVQWILLKRRSDSVP